MPVLRWRKKSQTNCKGSSGDVIVGHFAVSYHDEAAKLGIDLNELYAAQLADGDINPPEWDVQGRQVNVYKYAYLPRLQCRERRCPDDTFLVRQFGFVPFAVLDTSSTGRQTREGSRTLEVRTLFPSHGRGSDPKINRSMHLRISASVRSLSC